MFKLELLVIYLAIALFGIPVVYMAARIIFTAYFSAKKDYIRQTKTKQKKEDVYGIRKEGR